MTTSPFRYPGGKAFLAPFLADCVCARLPEGSRHYAEPFCGGAGAAIALLANRTVDHVHLNDADLRIYSAWRGILTETERFIDAIKTVNLDVATWQSFQHIVTAYETNSYSFELGFAIFYLNRTSRSGIAVGAGPIGGYQQTGKWKIDARFNREGLSKRVEWIGSNASRVDLTQEDALQFLIKSRTRTPLDRTLFFVDPPYVKAGGRLYLDLMSEGKHIALSEMLQSGALPHWVLTYDDHSLIRDIYRKMKIDNLSVNYSLQKARKENEILIESQF